MDDLIVISDLHMGRGQNPDTGRFYALETFFYDDDFFRFCEYLVREAHRRQSRFKLIFNGDTLDFLRIEPEGDGGRAVSDKRSSALTPDSAATLAAEILAGHPKVVRGIAHVLLNGFEVVFLPGNHDIELQWEPVQEALRRAVHEELRWHESDEHVVQAAFERLQFRPWFYHEEGRVWIEHGCQYDPENSFRFPLRSRLVNEPSSIHEAERDLPLGNFFQRYLYNDFGSITFIVPTSRANLRYLKWFLLNRPRWLLHFVFSHAPFLFQVLRRLAKAGQTETRRTFARAHEEELALLAMQTQLGDKLAQIDSLKQVRADVVQASRTIGWQLAKVVGLAFLVFVVAVVSWFVGFLSISQIQSGFGLKTVLFLCFNVLTFFGGVTVLVYAALRVPEQPPARPLSRAAANIAAIVGVPLVSFGHTHDELVAHLRGGDESAPKSQRAWYFNTGTWIAVFTHDVLLPRERVQYTFLRIRGTEGRLLQWSPARGEARPVILLDESPTPLL